MMMKDDESFPSYLARMKKDACWAGNLELVAASNLLSANIHVHQSGQPRWVVGCVARRGGPMRLGVQAGSHCRLVLPARPSCTACLGSHAGGPAPVIK